MKSDPRELGLERVPLRSGPFVSLGKFLSGSRVQLCPDCAGIRRTFILFSRSLVFLSCRSAPSDWHVVLSKPLVRHSTKLDSVCPQLKGSSGLPPSSRTRHPQPLTASTVCQCTRPPRMWQSTQKSKCLPLWGSYASGESDNKQEYNV